MRQTAKTAVRWLEAVAIWLVTAFTILFMFSITWQVFSRYVIDVPAVWTEEIGRYSFINMVFIGSAIGVRRNTHFGVTLLTDMMSQKTKIFYIRFVVNAAVLSCAAILFYFGWEFFVEYGFTRVSPTFLVPMAWAFAILPFSAALMLVFAVYNMATGDIVLPSDVADAVEAAGVPETAE